MEHGDPQARHSEGEHLYVTLITGALFLHEPITLMSVIGALLIICGVITGVWERKGACPEQ